MVSDLIERWCWSCDWSGSRYDLASPDDSSCPDCGKETHGKQPTSVDVMKESVDDG